MAPKDLTTENRKSIITFIFLALLILFFPIDHKIFLIFRITDFLVLALFVWGVINSGLKPFKSRLSLNTTTLIYVFCLLFVLSMLYGALFVGIKDNNRFIFIYKYSIVFILFWLTGEFSASQLSIKQIQILLVLLFSSFIFMVANVFIDLFYPIKYLNPLAFGVRHRFSQIRPSFPFTSNTVSDAHLYGAYLANMIVALIALGSFKVFKISPMVFYVLAICSLPALLLTGARASILVLSLFVFIMVMLVFVDQFFLKRKTSLKKIAVFAIIFTAIVGGIYGFVDSKAFESQTDATFLLKRSFAFGNMDNLATVRIRSILSAVNQTIFDGPILIGIGITSSELVWYDNAIAAILVSSGLLGVIVFALIILSYSNHLFKISLINRRKKEYFALASVFCTYALINVISTEFFLVTRSITPFALLCGLLIILIKKPKPDV